MLQSVERQPGGHWAGAQLGFHQDVPRSALGNSPSCDHWRMPHARLCGLGKPVFHGFSHLWRSHFHPLSGSFCVDPIESNWPIPSSIANCCDYRKDLVGSGRPVESSHGRPNEAWWHGAGRDWDRDLHDQCSSHFGNQHEGTAAQGLRALSGRLPAD